MIELHLTRGDNQEGVRLRFPTTPAEIGEAFALLDTVSRYAGDVRILDVKSPVANIGQYVRYADLNSREDMQKLNTLAERIGGMSKRQRDIFAGALDAESVNGLDDVLRVSESLEEYTADYTGTVSRIALNKTRYVAIFEGTAIVPVEPAVELPDVLEAPKQFNWAYVLVPLGVVAAAGGGVGIALFLKRRRESDESGGDAE